MSYKAGKTTLALGRAWHKTSCEGRILGRQANRIAHVLMGKHKPTFDPKTDAGDFVVVEHADKIGLTGQKWYDKKYFHHSGHPGGDKWIPISRMRERDSTEIIKRAVKGMMPSNRTRDRRMARLMVYPGEAPAAILANVIKTWRDPEVQALRDQVKSLPVPEGKYDPTKEEKHWSRIE